MTSEPRTFVDPDRGAMRRDGSPACGEHAISQLGPGGVRQRISHADAVVVRRPRLRLRLRSQLLDLLHDATHAFDVTHPGVRRSSGEETCQETCQSDGEHAQHGDTTRDLC